MKKFRLLLIGYLACISGFSQNVEITLYQNSIKVHNDTLYFKYRIENKSDSVFILYEIESVCVKNDDEYLDLKDFYERASPRLWAVIIGPNNKYPTMILPAIIQYRTPDTPISPLPPTAPIKCTVLKPQQNIVYDDILIFNSIKLFSEDTLFQPGIIHSFLFDGIHTFQLEYFSGPAFRKKFRRDKQQDSQLKNSVMFEGIIKSNVCYFSYPDDFWKKFSNGVILAHEFQQTQQDETKHQSLKGGNKVYIYLLASLFFILSLLLCTKRCKIKKTPVDKSPQNQKKASGYSD